MLGETPAPGRPSLDAVPTIPAMSGSLPQPAAKGRPIGEFGRAPGAVLADRYRLLSQVGTDATIHAEFWQARDLVLERDAGVTLLRKAPDSDGGGERALELLARGLRSGRFEHPGCARLLDVISNDHPDTDGLPADVHGIAVTEWVEGTGLAELIATGPLRTGAVLGLLDPLAMAADAAHRHGLVLGCSHPQRVRFAAEGGAKLAFALPSLDASPADDVRGLGALLYALLTGHWPLSASDAEQAGLPPAPRDVQGAVVPPGLLRPGLSVEAAALAAGTLGAGGTGQVVHTAAAVHRVITELLEAEAEAAVLPPPDDGAIATDDEVWRPGSYGTPEDTDRETKRKLSIGLGGLGLGMLVVVGYVGVQLGSMLGVTPTSAPPIVVASPPPPPPSLASLPIPAPLVNPGQPGQPAQPGALPPGAPGAPGTPGMLTPGAPGMPPPGPAPAPDAVAAPGAVVPVTAAHVFDLTGDPDNPGRLNRAFDADPNSGWATYNYRRQFPALKRGVGIMVSFAAPVQLSALTLVSPSKGTQLEIRAADSPDASLDQTQVIGTASLDNRDTRIALTDVQPVQNVLLWITKLGGSGDEHSTQISNIRFERVPG
jgi:hypothetical protein